MTDSRGALTALTALGNELGWWNACLYGVHRALRRVSRRAGLYRYLLVAQPVAEQPLLPRPPKNVSVRRVDAADYRKDWFGKVARAVDARFRQGARCYVAFNRDGLPVGCIWIQPGVYLEDEVRACFVPQPSGAAVWDFDVFVRPEYRAGRTFACLWDYVYAELRADNVRWTMSRISAYKAASLRSHSRLGARAVGSAIFLRAGRWQLTVASVRPWLHFGRRSRPALYVGPRVRQAARRSR